MPDLIVLVLMIIAGFLGLICLVGAFPDHAELWLASIVCFSITAGLCAWYRTTPRPPDEIQVLAPIKIKDMVFVFADDETPYNVTKYFGKEIDLNRYDVKMFREMDGWNNGIYWTSSSSPRFKLISKQGIKAEECKNLCGPEFTSSYNKSVLGYWITCDCEKKRQ